MGSVNLLKLGIIALLRVVICAPISWLSCGVLAFCRICISR